MIKLNIQLFGGPDQGITSSDTDAHNKDTNNKTRGSQYVGKISSDYAAGKLFNDTDWDKLTKKGRANGHVKKDAMNYFSKLGLNLNIEKNGDDILTGDNKSNYHNTIHIIESKDDKENTMKYIVHIDDKGRIVVSEPLWSQKMIHELDRMFEKGEITDMPEDGYYSGANLIDGKLDWGNLPDSIGKDSSGNDVYLNDKGAAVDRLGNPIKSFTDNSGTNVKTGSDGRLFVDDGSGPPNEEGGTPYTPPETPYTPPKRTYSNALDTAYNQYYNDLYSLNDGTLGKSILDNNVSLFEKEAQNMGMLAEAGLQNQAIAQAQGIKQATDAIKNERLAQLRSGMSESQLADRELQMLMGSVNNFANQAQAASQERMAASLGMNTAKEQAFNQYIEQTTALGQNATANYASEVGDIYQKAYQYQQSEAARGVNVTMDEAIRLLSGQENKKQ